MWICQVCEDGFKWLPSPATRICHFVDNCKNDAEAHPSYIPTIFPPIYKKTARNVERARRMLKRSSRCQSMPPPVGTPPDPHTVSDPEATTEAESSNWYSFATLVHTAAQAIPTKCTSTIATQTDDEALDVGPLWLLLSSTDGHNGSTQVTHTEQVGEVILTEGDWRRRCGFLGFQSLRDSEQALQDLCGVTMTVFSLLLCLTPATRYGSSDIPAEDKLVLFLMKLKLGISYTALDALFSVHKTTASRIFRTLLDTLNVSLERWVFVPAREISKESLPPAFKTHYPDCTFIIDCTEIRTESPSDPEQQHYLYSSYKSGYTIKLLIGIILNGIISFISKIYEGRQSDCHMTVNSGFLSLVQPGDVVLSDKGFPSIRTYVAEKCAVLIMPPFSSAGQQFSQEDMDYTYHIAQVRIHVERVIQRLKTFHILKHRVPLTFIPHMNQVVQVCSALDNMQAPIIKK
ncbi:uncharacterized protein LOC120848270 [Ixodes scapularis]|uniref:uncharacterized protein LOC120848270 n=1 Tax=Ixodes scapularis TaxID=6945 RepID=UPI001C37F22A|nr:uncharacterized protein LOC120848270 [Ixodes scapularis]